MESFCKRAVGAAMLRGGSEKMSFIEGMKDKISEISEKMSFNRE